MKLGGWLIMLTVMAVFLSLVGLNIAGFNAINDFVGVEINSTTTEIISADLESTSFWDRIFKDGYGILAVILAGVVAIGFFARGYDTSLVIAPFILLVAGIYISMFWGVISYVQTIGEVWLTSIIAILFVGLGVGFAMSCLDYFAGR